jgi:hypothetical protein
MGGFWPRIYVVKNGHARDIYSFLQTRNFGTSDPPPSLFTCCYLLASAFHRLCWLSRIKLQSGRSADLRILSWYSIERFWLLAWGRGCMRIVHRVALGNTFRFCTCNGRTCSQRLRLAVGGQPDHERQTHKNPLFPTDLQNLMPHLGVCDPSAERLPSCLHFTGSAAKSC